MGAVRANPPPSGYYRREEKWMRVALGCQRTHAKIRRLARRGRQTRLSLLFIVSEKKKGYRVRRVGNPCACAVRGIHSGEWAVRT